MSAKILFHSLKENIGIERLKLTNCIMNLDGFERLKVLMQKAKMLKTLIIDNCKYLGASNEEPRNQITNMISVFKGISTNISLANLSICIFSISH